ncbi:hypothetical protein H8693_10285 [Christensenellaceae bacterium NSJ-63]|uniref:Uncharacterized protein n=1 Tax=Guopingia tenuis TaxID=2763656 RepID=A0A926HXF3_9FIRM|nr:hypothetical protein [Guopingia tenuis]MBC8539313.1 hypothetical protein [Guopingia tenuis]
MKVSLTCFLFKERSGRKNGAGKTSGRAAESTGVEDKSRESFFAYFLFKESKARGKAAEYMPNPTICRKKVEGEHGFAYTGNRKRGGRQNAD